MRLIVASAAVCCLYAAHPADAASPFDGVYAGQVYAAGNGGNCSGSIPDIKVFVRDGSFNFVTGGNRVPVAVAADGSFSAQNGGRYVQGKIAGNRLSATTSGGCNYIWDLRKQ